MDLKGVSSFVGPLYTMLFIFFTILFVLFFAFLQVIKSCFGVELETTKIIELSLIFAGFGITIYKIGDSNRELIESRKKDEIIKYTKEAYSLLTTMSYMSIESDMIHELWYSEKGVDMSVDEFLKTKLVEAKVSRIRNLSRATALIYLIGNEDEIMEIDKVFLLEKSRSDKIPYDNILTMLRSRLRIELNLKQIKEMKNVEEQTPWFAYGYKEEYEKYSEYFRDESTADKTRNND